MLTHNIELKVLSLFLAAVLWLFVAAEKESEIGVAVPVACKNLSPGLVIVNQPPPRIDVRIAGPKILLLKLPSDRLSVVLDLQDAREGTTSFPGLEKAIHVRAGVRVTRVTPAIIEVRVAKAGTTGH